MQNYMDSSLHEKESLEIMVHPRIENGKYIDWVDFERQYSLDEYSALAILKKD